MRCISVTSPRTWFPHAGDTADSMVMNRSSCSMLREYTFPHAST